MASNQSNSGLWEAAGRQVRFVLRQKHQHFWKHTTVKVCFYWQSQLKRGSLEKEEAKDFFFFHSESNFIECK